MARAWAAAILLGLAAAPGARAACEEAILPLEVARPGVEATWRELMTRRAFPWGSSHVWGHLEGDRIAMAAPYERLNATHKRQALDMLKLGGLPATLRLPSAFDALTQRTPMAPYDVYAHDGRIVSMPYDGCTRLYFFTEWDRARLRWRGRTPPARKIRYPLDPAVHAYVTETFWARVGREQPDIVYLAWVPEQGHFEITIAREARYRYRNRIVAFWAVAPMDLHYVVLDADGERLEERGLRPPVWRWAPPGYSGGRSAPGREPTINPDRFNHFFPPC